MYHRIADDSLDPWGLAVSRENFASHLQWLARNRIVFPLAEFAKRHRAGTLPAKAVAITLDDGYACNAAVAAPLLAEAGVPATIFLPAELIERGDEFWWDELARIVLDHGGAALQLDGQAVDLGERHEQDRRWLPDDPPVTPRQIAFHRIWSMLRQRPPAALEAGMRQLREQYAGPEAEPDELPRPMTVADVRSIQSSTVEFGSHALTHPSLPSLSPAEKAKEIGESVARCEALTGVRPRTFAYPYGDFDPESEQLVEEAGFDCACTTRSAFVTARAKPYALPRLAVGNWTVDRFARNLLPS
jgi:peptidoglycan/xylan/chitin deacetylase (PgdA/CDA1 family)